MKRLLAALLSLAIGNAAAYSATITWTNTSGGNWSAAANWSPNQVPGAADDALITVSGSYAVTLDTSPTVRTLTLGGASGTETLVTAGYYLTLNNASLVSSNGVLNLSGGGSVWSYGLLSVSGQFIWTGGYIGGSLSVATSGLLELAGQNGNGYDFYGALTNAGTVQLVSGNLRCRGEYAAGELVNLPGGIVDARGDVLVDIVNNYYGTTMLINQGIWRKSRGLGTCTLNPPFYNSGTVDAQSGTISINGGGTGGGQFTADAGAWLTFPSSYQAATGAMFSGAGTVLLSGGTFTVNGAVSLSNNVTLAGATWSGNNAVINGALNWTGGSLWGQNTLAGALYWFGGYIGGALTVASTGLLVLEGQNGYDYDLYGTLTNAGTVQLVSGNLRCRADNHAGQFVNRSGGLVDVQADVSVDSYYQYYFGLNTTAFINQGTLRKSGDIFTTGINVLFYNSGTVDAQSGMISINSGGSGGGQFIAEGGAILDFTSNFEATGTALFSGAGTMLVSSGVFTLDSGVTLTRASLVGGTLTGAGTLNGLNWSGGTLSGQNTLTGLISWSGGNFSGQSALLGRLNWTSGTIYGSLTVASNGVMVLAGQNGYDYDLYGAVTNAGTFQLVSGNLHCRGDSAGGQLVNLPAGLVDLRADVPVNAQYNYYGTIAFVNQGMLRKSGGLGTSTINPAFYNTGTVDVQSGTINVNGGGSGGGLFTADAGATLAFGSDYATLSGAAFSGAGQVRLNGGTFTVNGSVTLSNNVTLAGSTWVGNNAQIAGVLNWTGGSLWGQSTLFGTMFWAGGSYIGGSLTVAANGLLMLEGQNGSEYDLYGTLTNAGTFQMVSGNLRCRADSHAGQLVNLAGALIDAQGDVSVDSYYQYYFGYNTAAFINQGTFRKSGGFFTTGLNVAFYNSGIADAQSGTIYIGGGGNGAGQFIAEAGAAVQFGNNYEANTGALFTGTGAFYVSGGTFTLDAGVILPNAVFWGGTLAGSGTVNNLTWSGGTLTGQNTLTGIVNWSGGNLSGQSVLLGRLNWTGGYFGGSLTVASNGLLVLVGQNGYDYDVFGALTNAGTVRLVSGNLRCRGDYAGGQFVNLPGGVVDFRSDVWVNTANNYYGSIGFFNQGTVRKSGGSFDTRLYVPLYNSGTVDVQSGAISVNGGGSGAGQFSADAGGTLAFNNDYAALGGALFTGAGQVRLNGGTFTANGSVTFSNNVALSGATWVGNNALINGALNWTAGYVWGQTTLFGTLIWDGGYYIGGSLTVASNGLLVLEGQNGGEYDVYGTLTNAGTFQLVSGNLRCRADNHAGQLVNLPGALMDAQADLSVDSYYQYYFGYNTAAFINQGTLRKSGGFFATGINVAFYNSGTVDAQTGTLSINGGGSASGSSLFQAEAGAVLQFANDYTVGDGTRFAGAGTTALSGGTLTINGTVTVTNLRLVAGGLNGNGTISGPLTWAAGGFSVNGNIALTDPLVVNGGYLTVSGTLNASNLTLAGGTLNGGGVMGGTVTWTGGYIGCGSTLTLATNGLLTLAGNPGTDYTLYGMLTNAGTVRLASGNLQLYGYCGSPSALVNLPGGLVDMTADISIDNYGWGNSLLVNQGAWRKSGGTGASYIYVTFSNSGLVDVQRGTLFIYLGGSGSGVFHTEPGATLTFPNGYTASNGIQFAGTGTNLFTGGTFSFNGVSVISNVVVAGGTCVLNGPATVSGVALNSGRCVMNGAITVSNMVLAGSGLGGNGIISGALNWSAGYIECGSALTIATDGVLTLAGNPGTDYSLQGILTNAGTVRLASGNLQFYDGCGPPSGLVNLPGALVDFTADTSIDYYYCCNWLLVNQGILRKSGGSGTSYIYPALYNYGVVDVQSGRVIINGGGAGNGLFQTGPGATLTFPSGYTASNGIQFAGTGTNLLTGGTFSYNGVSVISNIVVAGATCVLNGPATVSNVALNSGRCLVYGAITVSNVVLAGSSLGGNGIISGMLNWSGGDFECGSTLTIGTDGMLVLVGNPGSAYSLSGVLTNAGTVRLVSANLRLWGGCGSPSGLVNLPGGLVDFTTDVSIDYYYCCNWLFVNQGTVRKSGGTGTSYIYPTFNNFGLVDVQTGAINFYGGFTSTGGSLNVGISGPATYGRIGFSSGAAFSTLALTVTLNNGFVPANGNSFTVLTYPSGSGTLASLDLPDQAQVQWQVHYGSTALSLSVANVINLANCSDVSCLQLNGSAALATTPDGAVLQLTPAAANRVGSAFWRTPISLASGASFSIWFAFRLSGGGGGNDPSDGVPGADGFALVLATDPGSLGAGAGSLGCVGIPHSVAIEYGTWRYPAVDPDGNHLALNLNGAQGHFTSVPVTAPMNDGNLRFSWVDYNGATGLLEVRVSELPVRPDSPALTATINLASYLGTTAPYVGLTASTASAYNQQDILSWQLASEHQVASSTPPPGVFHDSSGGGPIQVKALQAVGGSVAYLAFELGPTNVLSLGAAWALQGQPNYPETNANSTVAISSNATLSVNFKPLPGWDAPSNSLVTVFTGTSYVYTATYLVSPRLSVTPVVTAPPLAATGFGLGPFTPSSITYTLGNSGQSPLVWSALKTNSWLTLSPSSGTLAPGSNDTVTVSINSLANSLQPGNYADIVTFTNLVNGLGTTTRSVSLAIAPPAQLVLGPATGLVASGVAGGQFTPSAFSYNITNIGQQLLSWSATNSAPWLTISPGSGTLGPGSNATVTVSMNTNANTLAAGDYSDTVTFTNLVNGLGTTARAVTLSVLTPANLSLGPANDFAASGYVGGPFTPAFSTYSLTNSGQAPLTWIAFTDASWLTVSPTNGALAAGSSVTVTLSINTNVANGLAANSYSGTVTLTNTVNGLGTTTRAASLTVAPIPSAPSLFTDAHLLEDGSLSLTLQGLTNRVYSILLSTNVLTSLTNWTPLLLLTNADGQATFIVPAPLTNSQLYFRAKEL